MSIGRVLNVSNIFCVMVGQSINVTPSPKEQKKERKKEKTFDHTHQLIDKKHEYTYIHECSSLKAKANKMKLVKTMSSLSHIKLCQKRQSSHEKVWFGTSRRSTTFYSAYSIK
jgi:hypothetical protein